MKDSEPEFSLDTNKQHTHNYLTNLQLYALGEECV